MMPEYWFRDPTGELLKLTLEAEREVRFLWQIIFRLAYRCGLHLGIGSTAANVVFYDKATGQQVEIGKLEPEVIERLRSKL